MKMGVAAAIQQIQKEPCRCVRCSMCGGNGFTGWGDYTETCEDCSGGIVEVCGRCQALADLEYDV